MNVDLVTDHYLIAAIWTAYDPDTMEPLVADISDFTPEAREQAVADVRAFLEMAEGENLPMSPEQLGHDISLTRNHHGAGFWDRGYGPLGERLTAFAHSLGEVSVYRNDDGKLDME